MKNFGRAITPELSVRDMKESVDFYTKKLGFELAWIWRDDYACVCNGGVQIFLSKSPEMKDSAANYIFVENADEVYEFYRKNGVKIVEEICSQPWGMREFLIEDNNGHVFRMGHGEKETAEIEEFSSELK